MRREKICHREHEEHRDSYIKNQKTISRKDAKAQSKSMLLHFE
jgi:hypothetical protein